MSEPSLEAVVPEREFATLLEQLALAFADITCVILANNEMRWPKRYYFRLQTEADELEVSLDDYGARHNRTFCVLTELTASIRGFALAGLSLTHLAKRLTGYGVLETLEGDGGAQAEASVERARSFVQQALRGLMEAWWEQVDSLGLGLVRKDTKVEMEPTTVRFRLPSDVDQPLLRDEEKRIAEVASKYLQTAEMLEESGLRAEPDGKLRETLLKTHCDEQTARVFEATVHNLQSAYDTHIGNTKLEVSDERLRRLRGHISSSLHLLESVTHLTHFVERHDNDQRSDLAEAYLSKIVAPHDVQDVVLHNLFIWAHKLLVAGADLARELLPRYTDLQSLDVELPEGLTLHARPASLVVAIATYHGTPVEISIGEQTANASSILAVMVLVGSHPEAREFHFKGDARPLQDIRLLFESGLGEQGLESLPEELAYLQR